MDHVTRGKLHFFFHFLSQGENIIRLKKKHFQQTALEIWNNRRNLLNFAENMWWIYQNFWRTFNKVITICGKYLMNRLKLAEHNLMIWLKFMENFFKNRLFVRFRDCQSRLDVPCKEDFPILYFPLFFFFLSIFLEGEWGK